MSVETSASLNTLQTWLQNQLADQLSLDPDKILISEPLTRYGLDSIDAVTLVGELEDWLELELPATLLWDYPTVEKAAKYLVEEFDVSAMLVDMPTDDLANTQAAIAGSDSLNGLWNVVGKS